MVRIIQVPCFMICGVLFCLFLEVPSEGNWDLKTEEGCPSYVFCFLLKKNLNSESWQASGGRQSGFLIEILTEEICSEYRAWRCRS